MLADVAEMVEASKGRPVRAALRVMVRREGSLERWAARWLC